MSGASSADGYIAGGVTRYWRDLSAVEREQRQRDLDAEVMAEIKRKQRAKAKADGTAEAPSLPVELVRHQGVSFTRTRVEGVRRIGLAPGEQRSQRVVPRQRGCSKRPRLARTRRRTAGSNASRAGPDPGDPDPAGLTAPRAGWETAEAWPGWAIEAAAEALALQLDDRTLTYPRFGELLDACSPRVPDSVRARIFALLPRDFHDAAGDALAADSQRRREPAGPAAAGRRPDFRLVGDVVGDYLAGLRGESPQEDGRP